MFNVEFIYNGKINVIQCNLDDNMKDICDKYLVKTNIDKNSVIFLYSGNIINEEMKLSDIKDINLLKQIKILVCSNEVNKEKVIIKSKDIICPICKENIRYKMNDYKIYLYDCKNGHRKNNILLEEFEDTQNINISEIICNICNEQNKSKTYNNEFFKCITCHSNICPICKIKHDNSHTIINYEKKNYICDKHNEIYIKYCKRCKENICTLCENEHKNHKNENEAYGDILPNIDKIKEKVNILRKEIDKFNNKIKELIYKLNKVMEYMEIYYKINDNILNNYNIKNRNYEILENINEINNNNIIEEIQAINNDDNINNQVNNIINIYNKMINKDISEISIIYNIDKRENDKIRLFGELFVKNNKINCKMIIENEEYELKDEYIIKNNKNDKLKIILKGIDNITDMSYMFFNCSSLSSLPDISKWNTNNVTNMSYLFNGCPKLKSLPDISKWNTNNVKYMSGMFSQCTSLSSLPAILKWNTNNVTKISGMFYNCTSLSSLPDISEWNINNVTDMSSIFYHCSSLSSLPDISNWNTNKITDMSGIFNGCSKLKKLPDISKWNTNNVKDMSDMFSGCFSLSILPDISKWTTNNVTKMGGMFSGCSSL